MRQLLLCFVPLILAVPAGAQAPPPIDGILFPFPGGWVHPPSASSAALALSDRWLGDEPFANPAALPARRVIASAALLHSSRQDLRAGNRNFDETPVSLDGAGAALAVPGLPAWLYAHQPVLRVDDFAFNRGTISDPSVAPATIQGQGESREARLGAAASVRVVGMRWGAAVEWTLRDDRYWVNEQSGAPDQGQREVAFDGTAVGWALGARYDSPDSGAGQWALGGGVRALPELDLEGTQTIDLLTIDSTATVFARREAGWEGGASGSYALTTEFSVILGAEFRSEQRWEGMGVSSGALASWSFGGRYRDPMGPWALRFGLGMEQQTDVPETRAGTLGLGFGYDMDGIVLDIGVLHRSVDRSGRPRSYDDRVVGSVRVDF